MKLTTEQKQELVARYYKLNGKFQFICAIIDLYSRKVIAHKISKKHSTQLITATFKLAYDARKPTVRLIFHSDRGTQYTSNSLQKYIAQTTVLMRNSSDEYKNT